MIATATAAMIATATRTVAVRNLAAAVRVFWRYRWLNGPRMRFLANLWVLGHSGPKMAFS